VAIGCAQVPDFSVISVRQMGFLRTTTASHGNSPNREAAWLALAARLLYASLSNK